MKIHRIIKEEIDDFTWVRDIINDPRTAPYYIIDNRSVNAKFNNDYEWVLIKITRRDQNHVYYIQIKRNLNPWTKWSNLGNEDRIDHDWLDRLLGLEPNRKGETQQHWFPHNGDTLNLPKNFYKSYDYFMNESFSLVEPNLNLNSIVQEYIKDSEYDIKNSLGNCAFFAKDFYDWSNKRGYNPKIVYLPQDERYIKNGEQEDHIVPMINNTIIDFTYTLKGVSHHIRKSNTLDQKLIFTNINDKSAFTEKGKYGKFGYLSPEIQNKFPDWISTVSCPKYKP